MSDQDQEILHLRNEIFDLSKSIKSLLHMYKNMDSELVGEIDPMIRELENIVERYGIRGVSVKKESDSSARKPETK